MVQDQDKSGALDLRKSGLSQRIRTSVSAVLVGMANHGEQDMGHHKVLNCYGWVTVTVVVIFSLPFL